MIDTNRRPDIDIATVAFLVHIGNRFIVFDQDGRLIYATADREAAEVARTVIPQASPIAEIKYMAGELALSFGLEVVEFYS